MKNEDNEKDEAAHDKRMVVVLIIGIAVGASLHFPMNILQMTLCGLSIAWRVPRMIKRL